MKVKSSGAEKATERLSGEKLTPLSPISEFFVIRSIWPVATSIRYRSPLMFCSRMLRS